MDSPTTPRPAPRVLRAVLLGIAVFVLLTQLPRLVLRSAGVQAPRAETPPPEPVYRDAQGRRINEADHKLLTGYEQARRADIRRHDACRAMPPLERMGCDRWVTEQKHIPTHVKQGDFAGSTKTTAQCREEVDAYWRPVIQDQREKGDDHAADVWSRRNWMPELQECRNYDIAHGRQPD